MGIKKRGRGRTFKRCEGGRLITSQCTADRGSRCSPRLLTAGVRRLTSMAKWVIEDEAHAEWHGSFDNIGAALAELRRRADISWDHEPNQAPCQGWRTCGRRYEIIEFDDTQSPWRELRRMPALEISAAGPQWHCAPR